MPRKELSFLLVCKVAVCACVNHKGHESRTARDMKAAPQSASQRATLSKQGCYLTGDRKAATLTRRLSQQSCKGHKSGAAITKPKSHTH